MTIARGQMNRQLYADGGVQTLTDILEPSTREMVEKLMDNMRFVTPPPSRRSRKKMRDEDEEIMIRLQELQKRPEYQYDETRPYEGPRDMRMSGGILSAPIINNRVNAFGGFGGFIGDVVGGIGDAIGGVVGGVGDAAKSLVKSIDLEDAAAIAAMSMGVPPQFVSAGYGAAGGDNQLISTGLNFAGGFQGGGGSPFAGASSSPFNMTSFVPQTTTSQQGIGGFDIGNILSQGNSFVPMKKDTEKTTSTANILGKVLQGGLSLYGAKKSYDDQKRINEQRQREYDRLIERQEE